MDDKKSKPKKKNKEDLKKDVDIDWHRIGLDELKSRLEADFDGGLTEKEATDRLAKYGFNQLTPPKTTPEWLKFLKLLFGGFNLLLWVGSLICFVGFGISVSQGPDPPKDNLYLAIVLIFTVCVSAIFAYYQTAKSSKLMDSFQKMIPQQATVIRGGQKLSIPVTNIVIGDVLDLVGGNLIPADAVVLESKGFKVDNSSITGESEPQKRTAEYTHQEALESQNFIIGFTYATEGICKAVVVGTGDNTVMGRIALLTSGLKSEQTPISKEIHEFIKTITFFAVSVGFFMFILSLTVAKNGWIDSAVLFMSMLVANVPEGLSVTITIALAITAKNMARKNCLVKNLECVETLGSTSVICSDKTGTLTQNRMTVAHLWFNDEIFEANTDEVDSRRERPIDEPTYNNLVNIAALCNRAEFSANQDYVAISKRQTTGDASESALLKYVQSFIGDAIEIRRNNPKFFEIPFNSVNKYQVSIHQVIDPATQSPAIYLLMKGAPERIIDRCSSIMINGKSIPLTQAYKDRFQTAYETMGGMGERVLGFCMLPLDEHGFTRDSKFVDENDTPLFPTENLCFVGLISMIDPPRSAVPDAVERCRSAGIRVVMVTGDHPITAKAIAKSVGIISKTSETVEDVAARMGISVGEVDRSLVHAAVVSGTQLREMNDEQLDEVIKTHSEIVFARTSPQQKLIIVQSFQRAGCVVAVTGDGVNDSPALRKADIGIAMGISGSDVAKQAADMILLDDNFASIVVGVEQGRVIFDNLKKSIAYTLTSNIPELLPYLFYILVGIPLYLGTITILCIDLGTDMLPAISLAYEAAEDDIMKRPPRDPKGDRLVNTRLIVFSYFIIGIIQAWVSFVTYCYIMMKHGFKLGNLLNIRSQWDDRKVLFVYDSFGQQWSYKQRKELELSIYAAVLVTVVVMQVGDVILSKTRKMSVITHGLLRNKILIVGIFFEITLVFFLIYTPLVQTVFLLRPFDLEVIIFAIICSFLMVVMDELRRLCIRRYPTGFVQRETYY